MKGEIIITDNEKKAYAIAEKVAAYGGRAYYVGGYVRDRLSGTNPSDIDVEIHGISTECFEGILKEEGTLLEMGESFGIYALKGFDIDFSFPRDENGNADPYTGIVNAAQRRDLTVNSMMLDVITNELYDSFGGITDLNSKTLRHVCDATFSNDPLRVMRTARFAAQLEFDIADETVEICKKTDLSGIAKERIELELKKALLNSKKPSLFFESLRKCDALDFWFPELKKLIEIEQSPKHHAEGNVWNHTMMVIDEGAKYKHLVQNDFGFMLSCVCHDFGKAICTENINGVIHAYGHETKGLNLIKTFFGRITSDKHLTEYVLNMCEYHMKPNILASVKASVKSTNRMFDSSIDPAGLIYFAKADTYGKISEYPPCDNTDFLFERLSVYEEYMSKPYVTGKDLIDAGLVPNKSFSDILSYSHKLRLSGIDKENNLKQTLSYAKSLKKKN